MGVKWYLATITSKWKLRNKNKISIAFTAGCVRKNSFTQGTEMTLHRPFVLLLFFPLSSQEGAISLLFAWPTPNWGKPLQLVKEKSRKDSLQLTSVLCVPGLIPGVFPHPGLVFQQETCLRDTECMILFFPSEQMALCLPCRLKNCQAAS